MKYFTLTFLLFLSSIVLSQEGALNDIKRIISLVDKNKIEVDVTTPQEIATLFKIEAIDTLYMFIDQESENYTLSKSFGFYQQKINSISLNTFYYDENESVIKTNEVAALKELKKLLGEPTSSGELYNDWEKETYSITFSTFSDGYSFYISSYTFGDYESSGDCVGDFYGLRADLEQNFTERITTNQIKIGITTPEEIQSIFGDSTSHYANFDGISLISFINYEGQKLSELLFDYFYDCPAALNILEMDVEDLISDFNSLFTVVENGKNSEGYASVKWSFNNQMIQLVAFPDGYSISINK